PGSRRPWRSECPRRAPHGRVGDPSWLSACALCPVLSVACPLRSSSLPCVPVLDRRRGSTVTEGTMPSAHGPSLSNPPVLQRCPVPAPRGEIVGGRGATGLSAPKRSSSRARPVFVVCSKRADDSLWRGNYPLIPPGRRGPPDFERGSIAEG